MPTTQLQFRRGNTAQTSVFTGAIGEVTVDTDRKTLTVHDGVTVGGTYVATNIQLTSAYGKANAANVLAQASYNWANTVNVFAQSAFTQANTANTTAEAAYAWANSINTFAVGVAGSVYIANTTAESAYARANVINVFTQSAFTKANAANLLAQGAFDQSNTNTTVLTSAYNFANGVNTYSYSSNVYLSGLITTANTDMKAYVDQANTGLKSYVDQANTGLKSYSDATYFTKSGGTISGAVTISGNNSLTVSGNLIVQGTTFSSNSTTFEVNDPLILLGVGNYYSDTRDIGFAAHYNDGTNAHSGLIRDYGTKEYFFFKGYTPEISANDNVDITHASFEKANVQADKITSRFLVANTATLGGIDAISYTSAAFASANTRANSFSGTTGSATPSGGSITFTSTNGITISGTSSTLTINSPQDLQSTASPTFKSISFANTATGNRTVVQSTTATVAQTAIDTWSTSTYRTAKYIVSMSSGANYHAIELLIIHNGTTPTITQYAEVIIGSSLATFDASIASTTLTLLANPATTSSITYNLLRDNIGA
jgi:hypothetical protein